MNMIFKIAKTELRNLFYSPIAWFLMVVFLIQCAMAYMTILDYTTDSQELGGSGLRYLTNLTETFFTGSFGLFRSVMQNLYLYIPLLTMGLISREINSGTIKLLYSSPVKIRDIVLGKFLGMMIYSLLLLMIIGLFMVLGAFTIKDVDSGMLLAGALGFFLLLCAYSAIGLFMSSLTTHQVVAAVSTFVMIGILSYIGRLWQNLDFVRDLTYFLSLSGRTEQMLSGLITTKDVIYFLIIVYLFLGLSIYKLNAARESASALSKMGKYAGIIISALFIGYISSRPAMIGYLDTTADKVRTLTPIARQTLEQLGEDDLEVTVYNNLLANNSWLGFPESRNNFLSRWAPYTRFKPGIKFSYVNYYDVPMENADLFKSYPGKNLKEIAALTAKSYKLKLNAFKSPEEIHKIIDLKPELNRFVMQLKYKNRFTFLRIFDDQDVFPSETEVSAALKRLMAAQIPKIAFLTGHLERNIHKIGDRDYKTITSQVGFRYALVNQGFDVDTLCLEKQDIPAGVTTLVLADPKIKLNTSAIAKIEQYIAKGGNLLIAGEPGKQDVLNPLLQKLGVQLMGGVIVQPTTDLPADLILNDMTKTAGSFTTALKKQFIDTVPVSMSGATGLSFDARGSFDIHPLLMTNKYKSWIKKGKLVTDSAAVIFSKADGDEKISVPTMLALERKVNGKEQRIVIAGDADFMSTGEMNLGKYGIRSANFTFNTALFSWLNYGEFPIDTSRPDAKDKRVTVTSAQVSQLNILFVWILPAILLALGIVLLIRRKRK